MSMTPEVVLRLNGLEITSRDPLCIRALWDLIGTSVVESDRRFLAGPELDRTLPEDRP